MNTPVKFEIAKLLKEKGFDTIDCNGYYHICNGYTKGYAHCYSDVNTQKEDAILAPTIADVVMWLYEKHGIWIVINPHKGEDDLGKPFMEFDPEVWSFTNKCILHNTKLLYFNSPIEAYEAAIKYCLEKII